MREEIEQTCATKLSIPPEYVLEAWHSGLSSTLKCYEGESYASFEMLDAAALRSQRTTTRAASVESWKFQPQIGDPAYIAQFDLPVSTNSLVPSTSSIMKAMHVLLPFPDGTFSCPLTVSTFVANNIGGKEGEIETELKTKSTYTVVTLFESTMSVMVVGPENWVCELPGRVYS